MQKVDKIEAYNLLGMLAKSENNSNSMNVSNLSSGIYIIKIYSNNIITSEKIIKE